MKPRDRRWNNVPLEKLLEDAKKIDSRTVWGGDPITYDTLVRTDALTGKSFRFVFEDRVMAYTFEDSENLTWSLDGGEVHSEYYLATPAPDHDEIIMVHHFMSGRELPASFDLIIDLESGYVVGEDSIVGHPAYPREVVRRLFIGCIDGFKAPANAFKPELTRDLVGKAMYWGNPKLTRPPIKYVFSAPEYCTYIMRWKEDNTYFMSSCPCECVKLKEGLYLCALIEQRQAGFHMFTVMNTKTMHDVQTGFGYANDPDEYRMHMRCGRVGHWTTMDSIFEDL